MANFNSTIGINAFDNTKGVFKSVAHRADRLSTRLKSVGDRFSNMAAGASRASAVAAGVIAVSLRNTLKIDKALAGASKVYGNEAAIKGQEALQKSMKATASSSVELNEIYSQLATSGIGSDRAIGMAITAAKATKAWDMAPDAATKAIAATANAFKLGNGEITRYADRVNFLSDGTTALARDVVSASSGVAALGSNMGLSAGFIANLSTTMLDASFGVETTRTSLKNMILNMSLGENMTKRQAAAFNKLGFSQRKLTKSMQVDPEKTILKVLENLKKFDSVKQAELLTAAYGKEAGALQGLTSGYEGLLDRRKAMQSGSSAGSLDREIFSLNKTLSQRLQNSMNSAQRASSKMVAALIPTIEKLAELANRAADWFSGLSEGERKFTAFGLVAVAALAPVLGTIGLVFKAAGTIAGVMQVAGVATGFLSARTTAAAMGFGRLGRSVGGFKGIMARAVGSIASFATGLLTLSAPAWITAAALAGIGYVAYKVWEDWDGVKSRLATLWEGMKKAPSEIAKAWNGEKFETDYWTKNQQQGKAIIQWFKDNTFTMKESPEGAKFWADMKAKATNLSTEIGKVWDNVSADWSLAWNKLINDIGGWVDKIKAKFVDMFPEMPAWLKSITGYDATSTQVPEKVLQGEAAQSAANVEVINGRIDGAFKEPKSADDLGNYAKYMGGGNLADAMANAWGNASVASNHNNAPKTLVEQGYVSNTGQVKKEDAAPVTAKLDPNSKVTVNAVIKVEGPGTVTSVSATGEGNAEPGSVGVQEAE